MSEFWSIGTFLGRSKDLSRRLGYWHVEDPELNSLDVPAGEAPTKTLYAPLYMLAEEARRWEEASFCQTLRMYGKRLECRPTIYSLRNNHEGSPESYPITCEELHRPLTLWHLRNFQEQLDLTEQRSDFDYLRETFAHILDRPAWLVGRPFPTWQTGVKYFVLDGRKVPPELLKNLVDAAQQLFNQTGNAGSAANSPDGDTNLTEVEIAVLQIIWEASKKGEGIQGKIIVTKLSAQGLTVAESTLRKHVFPKLKKDHNVMNSIARGGYYDSNILPRNS